MKQASRQQHCAPGRAYISPDGVLNLPDGITNGQQPSGMDFAKADNKDAQALSILVTGTSREGYFLTMVAMGVEWLMINRGVNECEAMAIMEEPMVAGWWYNHFMDREKRMAAALADYFDKRLKLQPQKLEPKFRRIAAQAETYSYWLRMHRMCFTAHTWQYRRLNESYFKLHS